MANSRHEEWLKQGVDTWNNRRKSEKFRPDLSGAEFFGATLDGVDLYDANLCGTNLNTAKLKGANFEDADLTDAKLDGADLQNANLSNTKLAGAHLRHATLIGVNLLNAHPWQARLYRAFDGEMGFLPYQDEVTNPSEAYRDTELGINKTKIDNIARLLGACRSIGDKYQYYYTNDVLRLYFRGESRCSWKLRPSAMRSETRTVEGEMLLELMSRQPQDFSGITSALAQWVLAQHHGLPTRLLDITRNPLVGLFHACEERDSQNTDGRLHIFAVPKALIKPFNSDAISVVSNVAKLSVGEQNTLLGRGGGIGREYVESMHRLYHFVGQEKPYFKERIDPRDLFRVFVVEPQQTFERLRAQSGAFLLSAFHERFERDKILLHTDEMPIYGHFRLSVPHVCKKDILDELRLLNITRGTLFPGLDETANETRRNATRILQ